MAVCIDATIRADNRGGLAYYERMGFREQTRLLGVPLRDGRPVDRVRKRLDLRDHGAVSDVGGDGEAARQPVPPVPLV